MRPRQIIGPHGRADMFDSEAIRRRHQKPDAGVIGWRIKAPWAHPVWHSYALGVIHLRPLPGFPPPIMHVKGATHEIFLFALNPEAGDVSLTEGFGQHALHPMNFGAQFIAQDDEAAALKIEECVRKIVNGELSPDTDHMQSWIAIFNAGMIKGNPDTAGETRIIAKVGDKTTEVVFDPRPAGEKPKTDQPWTNS